MCLVFTEQNLIMEQNSQKRLTNVTLLMDFGETGGEGVDVEWIRSVADLEF